jgi:hypothetical protein
MVGNFVIGHFETFDLDVRGNKNIIGKVLGVAGIHGLAEGIPGTFDLKIFDEIF